MIVEVDGVLCDVHCDLHRLAFNEAFVELGMEGASWSEERYLSLLRTGGGHRRDGGAVLSLLRVPHPRAPGPDRAHPRRGRPGRDVDIRLDATGRVERRGRVRRRAGRGDPGGGVQNPLNRELLAARRRLEWIDQVVAKKDERLRAIVSEGRLKLRKGALDFIDECLLEDGRRWSS